MRTLSLLKHRLRLATDPPPPPQGDHENYTKGFLLSIAAHLAILVAVILKAVVFPSKPVVYIPTLRVDLVGLPDVLKKDLIKLPSLPTIGDIAKAVNPPPAKTPEKPVDQKPPAKEEMVYKPKPVSESQIAREQKAKSEKLKNALARIKALEKIRGEQTAAAAQPIKGNQVSQGSSLSGDAKESAQASYFDFLRERLQEKWALPIWVSRQNLSAQVQLYIDPRGRLHAYRFTKPSGNTQFDDAVKQTISQSQPFPAPPAELGSSLLADGILVGFPL